MRQVPAYETQPFVRLRPLLKEEVALPVSASAVAEIPPPKELVAVPVTANTPVESEVEVELVVVLFTPVKFCSVVLPVATIFCAVSDPTVPDCAKRLVDDALCAKEFVLVLLVIVALVPVRVVKSAEDALRTEAKKFVLVAAVEVLRRMLVKMFAPPNVFASPSRVDEAEEFWVRQTPAIA